MSKIADQKLPIPTKKPRMLQSQKSKSAKELPNISLHLKMTQIALFGVLSFVFYTQYLVYPDVGRKLSYACCSSDFRESQIYNNLEAHKRLQSI